MITQKQMTAIAINGIVLKMLLTFPRMLFEYCGNAAWIAGVYTCAMASLLFWLVCRLYKSDSNVIITAERIGGRVLRIIIGIAAFAVISGNIMNIFRIFPEVIKLVLLQKTYVEAIMTVFVVCVIFGASCGMEAIARVTEMFVPIAGIIFVVFVLMLLPEMEVDYLFPVLGNGSYGIFVKGMSCLSLFADLLTLNILIPHLKDRESYRRAGNRSITVGGACVTALLLVYGLCYVYPASEKFIIPIYQLERQIHLSDFFSRLEAVYQFIWSVSIMLYVPLSISVLAEVWCETFRLKHSKPLIAPITVILAVISILPKSLNDSIILDEMINKYIYIPAFLIPMLVGVLYKWKMFHVKQKERK